MVIVDSSVWVDYLRNAGTAEVEWLDRELERQRLGITDLILCEVLQGIPHEREFQLVLADLSLCQVLGMGGANLAIGAARNFLRLRQRGTTARKTIACLIATFCIEQGHELLHRDKNFDVFERSLGLRVVKA